MSLLLIHFLYKFRIRLVLKLNASNQDNISEELAKLLEENDFIYRIGSPNRTLSERLQLLILKLIILLWEEDEDHIENMEEKLKLVDDIRHELTFLRARYYKQVFTKGTGIKF